MREKGLIKGATFVVQIFSYVIAYNFSMHSVQFIITSRHYNCIYASHWRQQRRILKRRLIFLVYITWWWWWWHKQSGTNLSVIKKPSLNCYNFKYTAPNMEEVKYKQLGMVVS